MSDSHSLSSISISSSSDEDDQMEAKIQAFVEDHIEKHLIARHPQVNYERYIDRDRSSVHNFLYANYFGDDLVYNLVQFQRRYQMRKDLFEQIMHTLSDWSLYFHQRHDACVKIGFLPIAKVHSSYADVGIWWSP